MHSSSPRYVTKQRAATWDTSLMLQSTYVAGFKRGRGEEGRELGPSGKGGIRALFAPFPECPNSLLPFFPFNAYHADQVIKCGEMRGYRSLPHVNIARCTGSIMRNCSNRNPAGKIKIRLSRSNSHIQSLHRKFMLACADTIILCTGRRQWRARKVQKPVVFSMWNTVKFRK